MAQMPQDFPDHDQRDQKDTSPKKSGKNAKNQPKPKPKPKPKKTPTKARPVKPSKMELDSDDDPIEGINSFGLSGDPHRNLDYLRKEYGNLQREHEIQKALLVAQQAETEELMRDNEILSKELNEAAERRDRQDDGSDEGDAPQKRMFGGKRVSAAGGEGLEAYERLLKKYSPEQVQRAVSMVQDQDQDPQDDRKQPDVLAQLRRDNRRRIQIRKNNRTILKFGESLVRAAKVTQLHAKLGTPGVPLTEKQVISIANRGDAPSVSHLAILLMGLDIMTEGIEAARVVKHQDSNLAYEIVTAHADEAMNVFQLLHRGLGEDVLFFADVMHVPEYGFLVDEINATGRTTNDLICDANIEKMIQIVRSQATATHQKINFQPTTTLDVHGQPVSGYQQNEVMFGSTMSPRTFRTSSMGYRRDSAAKPTSDDSQEEGGSGKMVICHFFQKKSGCKKGARCRFLEGHHCATCGSRAHGSWKHSSKSRYSPYGKKSN